MEQKRKLVPRAFSPEQVLEKLTVLHEALTTGKPLIQSDMIKLFHVNWTTLHLLKNRGILKRLEKGDIRYSWVGIAPNIQMAGECYRASKKDNLIKNAAAKKMPVSTPVPAQEKKTAPMSKPEEGTEETYTMKFEAESMQALKEVPIKPVQVSGHVIVVAKEGIFRFRQDEIVSITFVP